MRESELLEHIYARTAGLGRTHPDVIVGPGDDAAIVRTPAGDLLALGVDQLVEGRHFTAQTPPELVARKALARSLSDLAAMGADPCWALATCAVPPTCQHARELADAIHHWGERFACPVVGGDLSATSGPLVLTTTTIGRTSRPVTRAGVRPDDLICITGPVGDSLATGHHLTFTPRLRESREMVDRLGSDLHAMIDVSDGLVQDARRLAHASGVRIEIELERVPLRTPTRPAPRAICDGEDYELLFAIQPDRAQEALGTVIGRATAGEPTCAVLDAQGKELTLPTGGYDHDLGAQE